MASPQKLDLRLGRDILIGILLFVGGCASASPGPQTWIDQPLNNAVVARQAITIQVHAADTDGVAGFEFFVNGNALVSVGADGNRLAHALYEWTPPEGGRFIIGVQAIDSVGNAGHLSISHVNVVASPLEAPDPAPIEDEDAEEITDTPTATQTETQTATVTSTPSQALTPTYTATSTSTTTPTVNIPPADTTPPVIAAADATPSLILTDTQGCESFSRTVSVKAVVGDESAFNVTAEWSVGGESGQVSMFKGDLFYEGFVGPVNTTGTLNIIVIAQDVFGNTSQAGPFNVTVDACLL